ncbi:hypothetical protein THAOC_19804 [Thalassiosira oceanica]|uniref:Uncharacterized protein n=1 Tax=Thalassiosira oceanica TaxID=159749 RepID=K0SG40_THAOC|nr:hypothetical protein THAOC_19804 [Thalassiosira oceanica]|eukprot:EJK59921.1 hypothetical protein THAOC_19804 [Thalassiosira oceanica]
MQFARRRTEKKLTAVVRLAVRARPDPPERYVRHGPAPPVPRVLQHGVLVHDEVGVPLGLGLLPLLLAARAGPREARELDGPPAALAGPGGEEGVDRAARASAQEGADRVRAGRPADLQSLGGHGFDDYVPSSVSVAIAVARFAAAL